MQDVPGRGGKAAAPDPDNVYHVENYGHPSKFGYKDIIPLWKAEKWDPDQLMALYKKAGAKYFVSMGTHHDNFFLWNSKIHRWNAVQMGPKNDVVGLWQKSAKKQGLRFGVSEHLGFRMRLGTLRLSTNSFVATAAGSILVAAVDGKGIPMVKPCCLPPRARLTKGQKA